MMVAVLCAPAHAKTYTLTIENHRFAPSELNVRAGEHVQLLVINKDESPEEFESEDLRREKIIKGGSEVRINIGTLRPGIYKFVGEFHADTARGAIIAK